MIRPGPHLRSVRRGAATDALADDRVRVGGRADLPRAGLTSVVRAAKSVAPLMVLGLVRLVVNKALQYQVRAWGLMRSRQAPAHAMPHAYAHRTRWYDATGARL